MSKREWLKERAFTLAAEIIMIEMDYGIVSLKQAIELAETVVELNRVEREDPSAS